MKSERIKDSQLRWMTEPEALRSIEMICPGVGNALEELRARRDMDDNRVSLARDNSGHVIAYFVQRLDFEGKWYYT